MAQDARPRHLANGGLSEAPGAAGARGGAIGGVDSALERLWHLLTSMRFALFLILVLAVAGFVGSLVIQAPPGVLNDPDAKRDWIDSIRPMTLPIVGWLFPTVRYGAAADLMDSLQLFEIFTSVWFRLIGAALAISTIACTVHRIPGVWRTSFSPHVDVGSRFFGHAPLRETIVLRMSPGEAQEQVSRVLARRRYRALATSDDVVHLYGDHNRWAPFGGLAGHLSIVVILAGAMIGSAFGFRDGQFLLAEGQTLPVPTADGLSVRLDAFQDTYYPETGAPKDYTSDLVLLRDGQEVAKQTIRVNDPLRFEGISFYQSFFGPAVVMRVEDAQGNVVSTDGVPLAWQSGDDSRSIGLLSLPGTGTVAWVLGTVGAGDPLVAPGQVRVELYQAGGAGTGIGAVTVDQGVPGSVGGLTFTFEREIQYTGLSVARDPGVPIVWLGCFLLLAGFIVRFMFPHRRVWGRIAPRLGGGSTVSLAAVGMRDEMGNAKEFKALVDDVRTALQAPVGN